MTIVEHSILQLSGPDGTLEFNVDPTRSIIKIGNGKDAKRFNKVDLWALVYAISGPEEQDKMMPTKQTEVLTYKRIHNVKLKKPMKAGEIMKVHCEMNVEKTVVEGLKGMIEKPKKSPFEI